MKRIFFIVLGMLILNGCLNHLTDRSNPQDLTVLVAGNSIGTSYIRDGEGEGGTVGVATQYSTTGLVKVSQGSYPPADGEGVQDVYTPTTEQPTNFSITPLYLGDMMVQGHLASKVTMANISRSGSVVTQWTQGGIFNANYVNALAKFKPDILIIHFGANEARWGTPANANYYRDIKELADMARRANPQVIIILPIEFGIHFDRDVVAQLRAATDKLYCDGVVLQGPDIDTLRRSDYSLTDADQSHFVNEGFKEEAKAWYNVLNELQLKGITFK